MGNIAAGRAFGMAVYLILVLILINSPADLIFTPVAWTAGIIINAVFLLMMLGKTDRPRLMALTDLKIIEILKESFPLAGASIIAQIVIMFPVIFIGMSIGEEDAGIYSAAFKVIILILVLDRVFNALFFPKIVNHINYMPEKVGDIFRSVLKVICFASTSIGLIALLLGEPVILFIYGEEYISAVPIFQYLIGYFIITLINSVFTYTLIGMHKEKIYTTALIIGAIIFFMLSIALTNIFGTVGMAIGLVIFEISALTYMIFNLTEIKYNLFRIVIWPVVFTLLTAFCLVELLHLNLFLEILIALTAIVLIGATIKIGKDEIKFCKQVLF
jgi:O-antigen/teichoic acid export membrane protein